jgi:hypothetical protein
VIVVAVRWYLRFNLMGVQGEHRPDVYINTWEGWLYLATVIDIAVTDSIVSDTLAPNIRRTAGEPA